jgi:hypothetical protein
MRARPRVAGLGRRAFDPLGHGWTSRRTVFPKPPFVVAASQVPAVARRRSRRAPDVVDVPVVAQVPAVPGEVLVTREAVASPIGWEQPETATAGPSRGASVCGVSSGSGITLPAILFTDDPSPRVEVAGRIESVGVLDSAPVAGEITPVNPVVPAGSIGLWETGAEKSLPDEVWIQTRDPQTVVVHWTADEAGRETAESRLGRGRWWVRIRGESSDGPVLDERPADAVEGSAILELNRAGREHVAELGYDSVRMGWHAVAVSEAIPSVAHRPSASPTLAPLAVSLATGETSGPELMDGPDAGAETVPSAVAWAWAWWSGGNTGGSGDWVEGSTSPASPDRAASRAMDLSGVEAGAAGPEGVPTSMEWTRADAVPGRDFWLRVNAEVIVHGSTERDARVTVGGRRVVLRSDGSFSFRFALPNGEFRIPVTALSRDGTDGRSAAIGLSRTTETAGGVGEHPMTPAWDGSLAEWSR